MIGALVAAITGSGGASLSSYESIATVSGTGSATFLDFTSIPSTFKHLQIRGIYNDGVSGPLGIRLNSDTGVNYNYHIMYGTGATISFNAGGASSMRLTENMGFTSNRMSACVIDFLDYTSTTINKVARCFTGYDNNGSGEIYISSALWRNTSAINAIQIRDINGNNFSSTTTFALYGIKEA